MNCPRCKVALAKVEAGSACGQLCPTCDGIWIAQDALATLARIPRHILEQSAMAPTLVADHPDMPLGEPLVCPICAAPLKRHVFSFDSGVTVDRCRSHGIWLDDGELASLLDYLSKGDADIEAVTPQLSPKSRSFVSQLVHWISGR